MKPMQVVFVLFLCSFFRMSCQCNDTAPTTSTTTRASSTRKIILSSSTTGIQTTFTPSNPTTVPPTTETLPETTVRCNTSSIFPLNGSECLSGNEISSLPRCTVDNVGGNNSECAASGLSHCIETESVFHDVDVGNEVCKVLAPNETGRKQVICSSENCACIDEIGRIGTCIQIFKEQVLLVCCKVGTISVIVHVADGCKCVPTLHG